MPAGATGVQGIQGDTGVSGSAGSQGVTGVQGATGIKASSLSKSITIESPTSSEDITIFYTNIAITIAAVEGVINNGTATPTVTCQIYHSTDRSAAGNTVFASARAVTSVTSGDNLTLGGDTTVPANSFVWLQTSAQGGTTPELHLTIRYTED